jgi:hypothetical protein
VLSYEPARGACKQTQSAKNTCETAAMVCCFANAIYNQM